MCIALRQETREAHAIVDAALELSDKPGHLEMDRKLGLLLQHHRGCGQPVTVAHVADAQFDQVAGALLVVDPQIEQGKVAQAALHLEPNPNGPDLMEVERRL